MSAARFSPADSGHNQVAPFVVALLIAVVTLVVSLVVTGLPH